MSYWLTPAISVVTNEGTEDEVGGVGPPGGIDRIHIAFFPSPWYLVSAQARPSAESIFVADNLEGNVRDKGAIQTAFGLGEPLVGATLQEVMLELMIAHGSGADKARWNPSRPSLRRWPNVINLRSIHARARINWCDKCSTAIKAQIENWQEAYKREEKRCLHQELLWTLQQGYRLPEEKVVDYFTPPGYAQVPPRPHSTLQSDCFDARCTATLGGQGSWVAIFTGCCEGDLEVFVQCGADKWAGPIAGSNTDFSAAGYNASVGSADMKSWVEEACYGITSSFYVGAITRWNGGQDGCAQWIGGYGHGSGGALIRTWNGCALGTLGTGCTTAGNVMKLTSCGCAHNLYDAASGEPAESCPIIGPVCSSQGNTNVLGGLWIRRCGARADDWNADALGCGCCGSPLPIMLQEHNVYTGGTLG